MRKIKHFLTVIITTFMLIGLIPVNVGGLDLVNADSFSIEHQQTGYGHSALLNWWRTDDPKNPGGRRTAHIWGAVDRYTLGKNGPSVYCVNPWVTALEGSEHTYESSDWYDWPGIDGIYTSEGGRKVTFSKELIETIALISYFGYDYPFADHKTNEYYAAAQEIIWENIIQSNNNGVPIEVRIYKLNSGVTGCDGDENDNCYYSPRADLSKEKAEIYRLIEEYRTHINWTLTYQDSASHAAGSAVNTNEVEVGDVIKVTTSGANMSTYRFAKSAFRNVSLCDANGNALNIDDFNSDSAMSSLNGVFYLKATESGNAKAVIHKKDAIAEAPAKPFLFKAVKDGKDEWSQQMIRFGRPKDPDQKELNLTVAEKNISLNLQKKDHAGKNVAGAKMGIYDGDTEVYTFTTTNTELSLDNVDFLSAGKTYTVKEAETPLGYVKAKDGTFSIPKSWSGQTYTATFTMIDGQVLAEKVDSDGNPVSGAVLQVLDGSKIVDEWTTDGSVHAVNNLEEGKSYVLHEKSAPEGYLLADDQNFTASSGVVKLTAIDARQPHGKLTVKKSIETADNADTTLIDRNTVTKIVFTLSVKDDIVSAVDGTTLYKAGDVYGKYSPDANGTFTVNNLPLGNYVLKETYAPDGVVLDKSEKNVTIKQSDETEIECAVEYSFTNKTTKVELSKKAATGDDELPGATLVVTDKDGNTIDEWVSGTTTHIIEGLTAGETYTMTETITPVDENGNSLGYVKASSVDFTVNEDGTVSTVTMIDKVVTVSKVDVGGKEVPGAKMSVTDKDGKVVDEWTSTKESHNIKNLEVGKEYVLHENTAPAGFVKATDIPFTVTDDGVDQKINVVDKVVTISKKDTGGEEVPGAEMSVTDEEGNIIDKWTSTVEEHKVNGLEVGKKYIMHEDAAPAGFAKATDIPFAVSEDGVDQHFNVVNKVVKVSKQDAGGEEVPGATIIVYDEEGNEVDKWISTDKPHNVENIEVGKTYRMVEESAPDGYYYSEEMTFTVTDDGIDQDVIINDELIRYQVAKIDDKDGNYVAGVRLRIWDITVTGDNGEYPMELVTPDEGLLTEEQPLDISEYLIAGHRYILEESDIINGVYRADEIEFEVPKYNPGTNDVITVTMVDTTTEVSVLKVDQNGNALPGAKMSILDSDGNVVYEWISSTEPEDISKYVMGNEQYTLREDESPFGFDKINEMAFVVTGTKEQHQLIVVTDSYKKMYVSVVKVDAMDQTKLLKGAKIAVYYSDTNEIAKDFFGNDATGETDGWGNLVFELPYSPRGYYAKEIAAPEGYRLSDKHYELVPTEDLGWATDNPVKIVVNNEAAPTVQTGDFFNGLLYGTAFMAACLIFVAAFLTRRKTDNE